MNVRTCTTGGLVLFFGTAWALCAQQPFSSAAGAQRALRVGAHRRSRRRPLRVGRKRRRTPQPLARQPARARTSAHHLRSGRRPRSLQPRMVAGRKHRRLHAHDRRRPRRQAFKPCASATQPRARDLARSRRRSRPHRAHSCKAALPLFSRDGHTLFFIRDHSIWSLAACAEASAAFAARLRSRPRFVADALAGRQPARLHQHAR